MPTRYEDIQNKDGFSVSHLIAEAATAARYGPIFTALHPCELLLAAESHVLAGTDAGTVTLNLEKLPSGTALDSGTTILTTAWNLKSTADTPVTKSVVDFVAGTNPLGVGDRIALKDVGTLTTLTRVMVTLYFKRLGKGDYR